MWLTADVEIPQELVDSARRDEIVLFVGAGTSCNSPSSLPLYNELVKLLAKMAGQPEPKTDDHLDTFVGTLPVDFDSHEQTDRIIRDKESLFNSTHQAIAHLAHAMKTVRVITTNYDLHLEDAAQDERIDLGREYIGPAVPIGSDFSGILHLHGSLNGPYKEYVLSDVDFAKAYLTEGWAARFLVSLFNTYSVVFIGYGMTDPIMRYLALGISSSSKPMYAFVSDNEKADDWERRGIRIIRYPSKNHHETLTKALEAWSIRLNPSRGEQASHIPIIVKAGVNARMASPEERDYLIAMLQTADGARIFAKTASDAQWLHWLGTACPFKELFTMRDPRTDWERTLVSWFLDNFVENEDQQISVLRFLASVNQRLSDNLYEEMLRRELQLARRKGIPAAKSVLTILFSSIHGKTAPAELGSSNGYLMTHYMSEFPLSGTQCLRPYLRISPPVFEKPGEDENGKSLPYVSVEWPCLDPIPTDSLEYSSLSKELQKSLPAIAEASIIYTHRLLADYGQSDNTSHLFRRSIEKHDQDQFSNTLQDRYIDVLRDYARTHTDEQDELIAKWSESDVPILLRLAINTVAASSWEGDRKVEWLLDRKLIFSLDVRHEVYAVLGGAAQHISSVMRERFLKYLDDGKNELCEQYGESGALYDQYAVLEWMLRHDPDWVEAKRLADKLKKDNGFAPQDHPDFSIWSGKSTADQEPLPTVQEFKRLVEKNDEALGELLFTRPKELKATTGEDHIYLSKLERIILDVVQSDAEFGVRFWKVLSQHNGNADDRDYTRTYRKAILNGWSMDQSTDHLGDIIPLAKEACADGELILNVADLLETKISQPDAYEIDPQVVEGMRDIAMRIWDTYHDDFTLLDSDFLDKDPFTYSLNCWPGVLAHFWINEIDQRCKRGTGEERGLDDIETKAIEKMLGSADQIQRPVRSALLQAVGYLHSVDQDLTERILQKLLGNDDTDTAFVWKSMLPHPVLNNRLLRLGFLTSSIQMITRIDDLEEWQQRQFLVFMLHVLSDMDVTHEERDEILKRINTTRDKNCSTLFMENIVWRFQNADSRENASIWKLWLKDYLDKRSRNLPNKWENEERQQYVRLIPHMGENIPAGIRLIRQNLPSYTESTPVIPYLFEDLPDDVPDDMIHPLMETYSLILSKVPRNNFRVAPITKFVHKLKDKFSDDAIQPLIDALTQQGALD